MDNITSFIMKMDELNVITDADLQLRIKIAKNFKKSLGTVFALMWTDILAGRFMFEHDRNYYEDEIQKAFVEVAEPYIELDSDLLLKHIGFFEQTTLDTRIEAWRDSTSGYSVSATTGGKSSVPDAFRQSRMYGMPVNEADVPKDIKRLFEERRIDDIAVNEALWLSSTVDFVNAINEANTKSQNGESEEAYKTWYSLMDGKERATHHAAHLQTVPINEPFHVGKSYLMYPGDTSLGADSNEIIKCRCFVKYTV